MDESLTIRETAHALGVAVRTIQLWIKEGKLKTVNYVNVKGTYIPIEEVKRLFNNTDVLKDRLFNTAEVCEFLGLKSRKDFVRKYITRNSMIKTVKVNGRHYIQGRELERFLNKVYKEF